MRRTFLRFSLALLPAFALVACTGGTITPAQIASDAQVLIAGLNSAVPAILAASNVPPATVAAIQQDMVLAQGAAATLSQVVAGQAAPASAVSTLVTAVNDIVQTTTTPPLSLAIPAPYESALVAAGVLLPVIEAEAGILPTAAKATVSPITPNQARLILVAAAAK